LFSESKDVDARHKAGHDEFHYVALFLRLLFSHAARVSKIESPKLLTALAPRRANSATPSGKIFGCFAGKLSVTVKGSVTPVTEAFRIQTNLFWNATGHADEA
jgi:hypothetical protein